MAAHAEQLGVHVLDEPAQAEIIKKRRRVLDSDVADYEIQVVERCEYVKIRLAFLMNVIRIQSLGIEMAERKPLAFTEFIKDIHVRTVTADPFRILIVILLKEFRFGANAIILA